MFERSAPRTPRAASPIRAAAALAPWALLAALLAMQVSCSEPIEGPAFRVDGLRKDFGRLYEGETRTHVFELASVGTEPIAVDQRLDACGCTSIEWETVSQSGARTPYAKGAPVAPGETLRIEVLFDSLGRTGPFDQPISLYGKFATGKIELRLAAEIEPVLELVGTSGGAEPSEAGLSLQGQAVAGSPDARAGRALDLGRIPLGTTASARATLVSHAGPLALAIAQAPPQGLVARLAPIAPDAKGRAERFELEVESTSDAIAGWRIFDLSLLADRTGGDGKPLRSVVRITAYIKAPVEAGQPRLDFQTVDAGLRIARTTGLRLDPPDLVLPLEPKLDVRVELEAPGGDEDFSDSFKAVWSVDRGIPYVTVWADGLPEGRFGAFTGVVRVELGLPRQPTLELVLVGTATGLGASRGAGSNGG